MRSLEIYVADDRYSVPTLRFAEVKDEAGAREIAERILGESQHHLSVEVVEGGRTLCVVVSATASDLAPKPIAEPESDALWLSAHKG